MGAGLYELEVGGGFRKAPERRAGPIEDLGGRKGRFCAKKGTKRKGKCLYRERGLFVLVEGMEVWKEVSSQESTR